MKIYKLHSIIIPIHGYSRAVLYDLGRNDIIPLPNELVSILKQPFFTLEDLTKSVNEDEKETVLEYFKFLVNRDVIFELEESEIEFFPKLNLEWDYPSPISNCIIKYNEDSIHSLIQVILNIENIGCKYFQIFLEKDDTVHILKELNSYLIKSSIQKIELILHHTQVEEALKLLNQTRIVRTVIGYGSSEAKNANKKDVSIKYVVNKPNLSRPISTNKSNMAMTLLSFTESQLHHTYFNRKLFIDEIGKIKNAPECEESFGNIVDISDENSFLKILNSKKFKNYWFVKKDNCDICKACEFRYLCIDSRIPIQRNGINEWYFKEECNYNPYIAKWKNDEGYKNLLECGIISKENGLVIDNEKIEMIFDDLWST